MTSGRFESSGRFSSLLRVARLDRAPSSLPSPAGGEGGRGRRIKSGEGDDIPRQTNRPREVSQGHFATNRPRRPTAKI